RTVRNKPLQYVLGTQPFLGADLLVHPPTLIPRWETEEWVDRVADRLVARSTDREEGGDGSRIRVLDLCTGTGCVALGLANRVPRVHAVGVDVRPAAVRLARLNARRAGLLGRSAFHCADIWELVGLLEGGEGTRERAEAGRRGKKSSSLAGVVLTAEGYFDVVTANPPYVTAREHSALGASVREWEDERALVAGEEGLAFYAAVCKVARGVLRELPATTTAAGSGGLLVPRLAVEVGEGQAAEVASIVREHLGVKAPLSLSSRGGGWVREVVVWRDMAGVERCVV
ncbi:S-adenosyl-L-methionine-dependent methyltransferase, partial [Zopfochytrium polystomum]